MSPSSLDPATVQARLRLEDLSEALEVLGGVSGDQLRRDVVTRLPAERVLTQPVDLVAAALPQAGRDIAASTRSVAAWLAGPVEG